MRSFENAYKKIESLLLSALPFYIDNVNKSHGDDVIISAFGNKSLEENCAKAPCFKFFMEGADFAETDRIFETTVFDVRLSLCLKPLAERRLIEFWRYIEAVQLMLDAETTDEWDNCKVTKVSGNDIYIRIEVSAIGS